MSLPVWAAWAMFGAVLLVLALAVFIVLVQRSILARVKTVARGMVWVLYSAGGPTDVSQARPRRYGADNGRHVEPPGEEWERELELDPSTERDHPVVVVDDDFISQLEALHAAGHEATDEDLEDMSRRGG